MKVPPEWLDMTTARIAQEYQDMAREIERLQAENALMRAALYDLSNPAYYYYCALFSNIV